MPGKRAGLLVSAAVSGWVPEGRGGMRGGGAVVGDPPEVSAFLEVWHERNVMVWGGVRSDGGDGGWCSERGGTDLVGSGKLSKARFKLQGQ